jgi:hypothetical protein
MTCSDLWAIHQRKCKNDKKKVSLVTWLAMKSLLVGIERLPFVDVVSSDILMRIRGNATTQDQSQERHGKVYTGSGPLKE